MSLAVVYSRAQLGVHSLLVNVEVHLSNGLPGLSMVGLPETAVRESKDRVRSALLNSGFEFPAKRITVNLAPADLPKQGGRYDLAIALGVLAASAQIPGTHLMHYEFVAELALSGAIRPVHGVLPCAVGAIANQRQLVCATDNGAEAGLADPAGFSSPAIFWKCVSICRTCASLPRATLGADTVRAPAPDLSDVRGQQQARRALEIAASGNHSLLLIGPPGTGKTLLASRLPGLLPPLETQQALESAAVASISAGDFDIRRWHIRPFRAPHHHRLGRRPGRWRHRSTPG